VIDLVVSQLTDVFRIGLIVGLVYTMHRTVAVKGRVMPLVLGVMFLAILLPSVMPSATTSLADAAIAGLISNSIILACVLALTWVAGRLRR
jgi:hypothetical protein